MTFNTLLRSAAVAAVAVGFAGAASAQTINEGPSVLERILGDVTSTTATSIGTVANNVSSVYANVAGTSLSTFTGSVAPVLFTLDEVLGNIDSSVTVNFDATAAQPLISESLSATDTVLDTSVNGAANTVSRTFQAMEGTLGDISTTAIGAVMDATASITTGAVQQVNDTVAGAAMAVSQSTEMESALLINASLNSANLDSFVTLDVNDYALDAAGIATTAIGAVGGGEIVAGNIGQLQRTVSSFVGTN